MNNTTAKLHELLAHDAFARRVARRLLSDDQAADDVVQDGYLAAMTHADALTSPRSWFAAVVRHRAWQRGRGESRRKAREADVLPGQAAPSPSEVLEREELRADLVRAVLGLEPRYRDPLLLRFYENLAPAEIAKRLHCPVETVRTRIRRGVAQIREALDARHGRARWVVGIAPLARSIGRRSLGVVASIVGVSLLVVLGALSWAAFAKEGGDATESLPVLRVPDEKAAVRVPLVPIEARPFAAQEGEILNQRESREAWPDAVLRSAVGNLDVLVARYVDGETGVPIENVEVSVFKEPHAFVAGWWSPLREATSGHDGWCRVPLADLTVRVDWVYVQAKGYAPRAFSGSPDEAPVRLRKGVDVPVRVIDHLNQPVAGVRLEYFLGCGHTPSVRVVTTDHEGRAVFLNVDSNTGEVWPRKDGFFSDYLDLEGYRPGQPPLVWRLRPGRTIRGCVKDAAGIPVRGALVGVPQCHRGPFVRTDDRGLFTLLGAEDDADLQVYLNDDARDPVLVQMAPCHGEFVTLQLPSALAPEPARRDVVLHCLDELEGTPVVGSKVTLVRNSDGFTALGSTDALGRVNFSVPSGVYRVRIVGLAGIERSSVAWDLSSPGPHERTLIIPATTSLRVERSMLPKGSRISVVTATAEEDVTDRIANGGELSVGRAVRGLRVDVRDDSLLIPVDQQTLSRGRVSLAWREPRELPIVLIDPRGGEVSGWVRLVDATEASANLLSSMDMEVESRARHRLSFTERGTMRIVAVPAEPNLAPSSFLFTLPEDGEDPTPLSVRFSESRTRVLIFDADGRPLRRARVELTDGSSCTTTTEGVADFTFIPMTSPCTTWVTADGAAEFTSRHPLVGNGPWTVRLPSGSLDVTACDERGEPLLQFAVNVDGQEFEGKNGRLVVRGVAPGVHRVVVAALRARAQELTVRVNDAMIGCRVTLRSDP